MKLLLPTNALYHSHFKTLTFWGRILFQLYFYLPDRPKFQNLVSHFNLRLIQVWFKASQAIFLIHYSHLITYFTQTQNFSTLSQFHFSPTSHYHTKLYTSKGSYSVPLLLHPASWYSQDGGRSATTSKSAITFSIPQPVSNLPLKIWLLQLVLTFVSLIQLFHPQVVWPSFPIWIWPFRLRL